MAERRIGIFGGTFDPVHIGHLVAAVNARYAAELDLVLMMVANNPWQKANRQGGVTNAAVRLAAVEAAVTGHAGLEASRLEIDREGPTYTIDTVRALQAADPKAEFFLVMGSDTAAGIDSWHDSATLGELVSLIIVNRPGAAIPALSARWRFQTVDIPAVDISSTDLRNRLLDGRPLDFLIPNAAVEILRSSVTPGTR